MLKIELTEEQKTQIEPYFKAVRAANENGVTASIGAQIWPDGIVVKLFNGVEARALSAQLGGSYDRMHSSAEDRICTDATGHNAEIRGGEAVPLD